MQVLPILFLIVLAAIILLISIVVESVPLFKHHIWPPPKKDGWQQGLSWTAFAVSMFGVPLVGVLDFQSLGNSQLGFLSVGRRRLCCGISR